LQIILQSKIKDSQCKLTSECELGHFKFVRYLNENLKFWDNFLEKVKCKFVCVQIFWQRIYELKSQVAGV
jgi:hypothetical protein